MKASSSGATSYEYCVDTINSYRASLGLPPYAAWSEQGSCSDQEAASDSQTGKPHGDPARVADALRRFLPTVLDFD